MRLIYEYVALYQLALFPSFAEKISSKLPPYVQLHVTPHVTSFETPAKRILISRQASRLEMFKASYYERCDFFFPFDFLPFSSASLMF
jgi:hypothetical protein